jgi:putative flippase GtrA
MKFISSRKERSDAAPWSKRQEFFRFILAGLVNLVLTYALYLALELVLAYPAAYTVSYACGIIISYLLNTLFVFKSPIRIAKAVQYPIVYLAQYLLGMALLYLLVELAHISSRIAPLVIPAVTVPATFLLSRYLIKGSLSG